MCIYKTSFLIKLLLFTSIFSLAQDKIEDTISSQNQAHKVDTIPYKPSINTDTAQYLFCELIVTQNIFGNEQDLQFEYGSIESFFGEKIYNTQLVKLSELKTHTKMIDALNLMGFYGWSVIHVYTSSENSYIKEHFVFQKKIIK